MIKATKLVLDKIDLENKTITQITPKERGDIRLWNPIALVHNDYTTEVPPNFEIFEDRIEITSSGGLPRGLSQTEFFEGYSVPRNKELMRVFKEIRLVEQLGSGVPRILSSYNKDCFKFSDNFLRMIFPKSIGGQIIHLPAKQKEVLQLIIINNKVTRKELTAKLKINASAIQKHLEALKDKKYIEREGGTRGYWKVNTFKK